MNKFDYYKYKQLAAIDSVLFQTEDYFYRKVCRWFSKTFSTPLIETYKLSWDFILEHYYESNLEEISYNNVYDIAIENYFPEFMDEEEKENQEFADSLIEEQNNLLRKKGKLKESQSLEQPEEQPDLDIPKIPPINLNFEE